MNDQELRQLVRAAIVRAGVGPADGGRLVSNPPAGADHARHPSFTLLNLSDGADADGPCIIEPAVPCNHCGYCKSYGH